MSNADSLLRSLKAIGFPQVNAYKSADFEHLFLDEELKPILESICDLDENNVLTSEELAEYAAINPAELSYLEKLAEDETLFSLDESDVEKRNEAEHLEEYLALGMKERNVLEKQKQLLGSHEDLLMTEKERYEKELLDAKAQFEIYSVQIVPQAEAELVSNLQSLVSVIVKLEALIAGSEGDSKVLPQSIFKDMDVYFDNENKIVNHVKSFLQKQFGVSDDSNNDISLKIPGYFQSKLLREVHFLRNIVKSCKLEEFSTISEKIKNEAIVKCYKKYNDNNFSHVFNISSLQLQCRLSEEMKFNEQMKEKEKNAKLLLSNAVSELVDGQCTEIGIAYSKEIIDCCNHSIEKIQAPLEHLLSQRSRLELVALYLNSYKKSFERLKSLVESVSSFIEKENSILPCMNDLSKEKKLVQNTNTENNGSLLDSSLTLLTVHKILTDEIEVHPPSFVSCEEVLKGIKKLFEDQAYFKKLQDEKLHHLRLMEEQSTDLQKYVYKGKQFSKLLEAHTAFNISLNKLDLRMSQITRSVKEYETTVNEKNKILDRSKNLKLARRLYIDAFLNPVNYEREVERIKAAYENELKNSSGN